MRSTLVAKWSFVETVNRYRRLFLHSGFACVVVLVSGIVAVCYYPVAGLSWTFFLCYLGCNGLLVTIYLLDSFWNKIETVWANQE